MIQEGLPFIFTGRMIQSQEEKLVLFRALNKNASGFFCFHFYYYFDRNIATSPSTTSGVRAQDHDLPEEV